MTRSPSDPRQNEGPRHLVVSTAIEHDAVIATAAGEIDLASARTFSRHLEATLTPQPPAVIADLTRVSFLSSTGLAALQIFSNAARTADIAFCLVTSRTRRPYEARTWLAGQP